MALHFPNGSVFGIATTYAQPIVVSAISNAKPAVATSAGTVTEGDVLVISSNWPGLNNRATQAGDVTSGITLLGIDTTNAELYPSGTSGGAGSLVVASDFVDFDQQGDVSTSGGDQQFWTGQFLEDATGNQIQYPTFKNARTITIPLYADNTRPWYDPLVAADLAKEPVVLRFRRPNGDMTYYNGYLSFDSDPSHSANNPDQYTVTFSRLAAPTLVTAV